MTNDIAWAAGLFEGEGNIFVSKLTPRRPNTRQITLALVSTDEDVVRRFHAIVNCGTVNQTRKAQPHHKPAWRWHAGAKSDTESILVAFLPQLGTRRSEKAQEALEAIRAPRPDRAQQARDTAKVRLRKNGRFA